MDQQPVHWNTILKRGGVAALIINGAGLVLAFGSQVLLARTLGVEQFGNYSFLLSVLSILVVFCCAGFDAALLRLVPVTITEKKLSELRGLRRFSLLLALALSLLGAALLIVNLQSFKPATFSIEVVVLSAAFLLMWAQNQLRQSILRGCHATLGARLPDIILRPLMLCVVVGAVAWTHGVPVSLETAWAGQVAGALVALVVGSVWVRRTLPVAPSAEYNIAAWCRIALPLLGVALLSIVLNESDKVFLGILGTPADVGVYAACFRLSSFVLFSLDALAITFAPLLAQVHASDSAEELRRYVAKVNRLLLRTTVPIAIALVLFAIPVLALFGKDFSPHWMILLILAFGQLGAAFFGSAGFALTMTHHQGRALAITAVTVALAGLLYPFAIVQFGITGLAITFAALTWLRGLANWAAARWLLGVNCSWCALH